MSGFNQLQIIDYLGKSAEIKTLLSKSDRPAPSIRHHQESPAPPPPDRASAPRTPPASESPTAVGPARYRRLVGGLTQPPEPDAVQAVRRSWVGDTPSHWPKGWMISSSSCARLAVADKTHSFAVTRASEPPSGSS